MICELSNGARVNCWDNGRWPVGSDGAAVRRRASGGVKAGKGLCCGALGPTPVGASKQPRLWRGWALLQWVQANSPACGVAGPYSSGCKQTAPVAWLGPVLTSLVGTREDFNQMSPETRIRE